MTNKPEILDAIVLLLWAIESLENAISHTQSACFNIEEVSQLVEFNKYDHERLQAGLAIKTLSQVKRVFEKAIQRNCRKNLTLNHKTITHENFKKVGKTA